MRKQASYRESELLAYALAEIELLKAALLRISDGRQLVLAPGSSMGTTPGIETSGHVLYGSKHTKALCVTAGSGLSVNYEDGAVVVDGTYYQVGSGNLAGLTNNTTNYVFVQHNGSVNKNTTGFPLDGIPLAVVVTVGGVVTSVIDARAYLSVQSPVTLGANLAADISLTGQALELCVQAKNTVLAGPISGSNAYPAFRSLNIADIPNLSSLYSVLAHTHDAYLNKDGTVALTGDWVQSGIFAIRTAGYMRVGSSAAPINVKAGDLTAGRLCLGTDVAFAAEILRVYNKLLGEDAATYRSVWLMPVVQPAANSLSTFIGLESSISIKSAFTVNVVTALGFDCSVTGAGTVSYLRGIYATGISTYGDTNIGVVNTHVFDAKLLYHGAGAGRLTATQIIGFLIEPGNWVAGDVCQIIRGLYIANLGGAGRQNNFPIEIEEQSGATGLNLGILIRGASTRAIWFSHNTPAYGEIAWGTGPDTNLYRASANVLKTDDSFHVGADLYTIGVVGIGKVPVANVGMDIVGNLSIAGIRNASPYIATPSAAQDLVAATAILANAETVQIEAAGGSVTLTSTPTIATGYEGQIVTIVNVDAANSVTLQDQGTLANSNLRLSANTITLGPRDSIQMQYFTAIGDWIQTGQVNVL